MIRARKQSTGGRPTVERAAEIGSVVMLATWEAIAAHGIEFRMEEVAAIAGVSKQAIYRRWTTKRDLILDTLETTLDDYLTNAPPPDHDPLMAMRDAIWAHYFNKDLAAWDRVSVFLQAASLRDPRLRDRMVYWRMRVRTFYGGLLHAIEGMGTLADAEIEARAEICMELMTGAAMALAMADRASDVDKRHAFETRWAALRRMVIDPAAARPDMDVRTREGLRS